jgi:uncharacterized OsmC-like protein
LSKLHLLAGFVKGYIEALVAAAAQNTRNSTMNNQATTRQDDTHVNGIYLPQLQETVDAIQQDRDLGRCKFRASNTWLGGNRNRSTISGFYAARQEIAHKQPFELLADEPPILAGSDSGANPVEHLLNALAACVTTSMVAHAAIRGIQIEELESHVEGDIDLNGFLGLDDDTPRGFTEIRINFTAKADPENIARLEELAQYSPVFNTLTQGAKVAINVAPK